MKKITYEKTMIIIRYGLLMLNIVAFIMYKETVPRGYIIYLLLFIINSQLRFFNFYKPSLIKVSLLIDIPLIYLLHDTHLTFSFVYFLLSCLDTTILIKEKERDIFFFLYLVLALFLYYGSNLVLFIINVCVVIMFILLMNQLMIENKRVSFSQHLYDELRIKEEELVKLNEELEGYASTIESLTLLRERTRITREIHDSIGHRLSASLIQLGAIEKMIDKDSDKAKEMISYVREYNQESLQNVRDVILELKPKQFETYEGILVIEQLIKNFKKLTGVNVKIIILNDEEKTWKLQEQQTLAIYRIIQEGLSNSLRHGKATDIDVSFNFLKDRLLLIIRDNGVGSDEIIAGNGLHNMKSRIEAQGGQMQYETSKHQGFMLLFTMPREAGGVVI